MTEGIFISFEGIEGSGKSTQAKLLEVRLRENGLKVMYTFEPGDTELGKRLRNVLLDEELKIHSISELLLYFSDRIQHVEEKIKPLIDEGFIVISDRFTDSTLAYQGYGRGVSLDLINTLNKILLNEFKPHLTVLLDLPVEIGLTRNKKINKKDRFEIEEISFHNRVRQGFLELASKEAERFIIIDATQPIDEIAKEIYEKVKVKLKVF
ncbi:MAG: dTMP kinase [Thermodesulfovibrio sp.]|uniref:dTMP kinase n=1 Tax=unclassified Thermodesulfovibrio TaxID=2645936 RepID=UPI00083B4AA1|nr:MULTISPECIES: dTMP kinase [unclassified Thermodesulfovibrio]MDI1471696.1 dTMP kinase [Thermodesulfovibrio sp. 1176]MDI6713587.1 dTMP kinase [Thermodesulfovibrio sp.]ODA44277.1 Thymidylate kinase [Thermodesulfovibrio sp. N1]